MEEYQVVGAGRIGNFLAGTEAAKVIKRSESPSETSGPIYVCTRNDSLDSVIESTPVAKRQDLVFLQNGMIAPVLKRHEVHYNTQALIYFAIQKIGSKPDDGGQSVVSGKWAMHLMQLSRHLGVTMKQVDSESFKSAMYEKLIWNCVFGLLGEVTNDTVGSIVKKRGDQVERLTEELRQVVNTHTAISIDDQLFNRLIEYSGSVSGFKGGLKEFEYRNGWFVEQQKTPLHVHLLQQCGHDC